MATKVIMPQLGESVFEGTVSKWLKNEGDRVNEFDPLLEINTDKVDTEIPSPASGVVLKILAPEGETVQVGANLAWIGEKDEALPDGDSPPEETKAQADVRATYELTVESTPPPVGKDRELGFISPVVAKIAAEHSLDLTEIEGTGQGGRITKKDVLTYLERVEKAPRPEVKTPTREQPVPSVEAVQPPTEIKAIPGEVLPLTQVRRAIAEHMVASKRTSPHVSTIMEADLSRVVEHRLANKEIFARDGVNLTFTTYFTAAAVAALKAFPAVNSSWSDQGVILHKNISIGIATSLGEEGLIVPVIRNADQLSLLGLARTINDLAHRARSRQLKPDEVKGGTFTITNHGISGSLFATPIINQPQAGILGVGAIQKRVIVIEDKERGDAIAIRPMVYISLTFDHRILDGAIADYFLGKVVESLQNWS